MSVLTVSKVKKHFAAQEILSGAELRIDGGEKIGLVGRNGTGKTTLLRLIEGLEVPDWGEIKMQKGKRMGHVPQRPEFAPGVTARSYVESGLEESRKVLARLEELGELMGEASADDLERLMAEHEELSHKVEDLGGWDVERRVETVLSGIGLSEHLWDREANTLSGGERSRTALSRELIAGHDLLLLDEPTNHLDLKGIEWLESYLRELKTAVLIVSHDRRLLDNAVTAIIELERGLIVRYPGNYSKYLQIKEERFVSQDRAYQVQQDFIRKEESFIKKHMGSQRTAEAKGRQKKLSHVVRLERPYNDVRRPVIKIAGVSRGGETVLRTESLAAGYDGKALFEGTNLRIARGQRIGVVGPNGMGKTTLLKVLAGQLAPLAGTIEYGHESVVGFFDQDAGDLRDDGTPFTEVRRHYGKMTDVEIRNHLARFLFRGGEVDKEVPSLSGGERARLALSILMLSKPSWLALDEPTNHLDLAARTALEEFLSEFPGTLMCVSHDREFLDGLCTHIIEVSPEGVREFEGNYSHWRKTRDAEALEQTEKRAKDAAKKRAAERKVEEAKEARQPKKKKGNPYKLKKVEALIIELEEKREALHASMTTEEVYSDPDKLRETQYELAEVERDLETANAEWEAWA